MYALQLYKQHFASEGGDDDEDEGDAVDGEGITDQLAPSANKKRLVSPVTPVNYCWSRERTTTARILQSLLSHVLGKSVHLPHGYLPSSDGQGPFKALTPPNSQPFSSFEGHLLCGCGIMTWDQALQCFLQLCRGQMARMARGTGGGKARTGKYPPCQMAGGCKTLPADCSRACN